MSRQLEKFSSTAAEVTNAHLCPCIDETLKINVQGSSASGLIAAALCHLCKAQTFAQTTQALLASLCGQIENPRFRDNLAKFIYGLTDSWWVIDLSSSSFNVSDFRFFFSDNYSLHTYSLGVPIRESLTIFYMILKLIDSYLLMIHMNLSILIMAPFRSQV